MLPRSRRSPLACTMRFSVSCSPGRMKLRNSRCRLLPRRQGIEKMRRQPRHHARPGRQGFASGQVALQGSDEFLLPQAPQQPVALGLELPAPACAGDQLGIVGQDRQESRFGPAEGLGAAVEIEPGGRVDAHDIATEGGVGRVQVQDLFLRAGELEAQGQEHLPDLFQVGAAGILAGDAHHLHGQGAAAADHAALPDVRPQGPADRPQVDAAVAEEAAVLILQQGLKKALRDRLHPGKAPLLVCGQAGAQQPAVGGEQHR